MIFDPCGETLTAPLNKLQQAAADGNSLRTKLIIIGMKTTLVQLPETGVLLTSIILKKSTLVSIHDPAQGCVSVRLDPPSLVLYSAPRANQPIRALQQTSRKSSDH